MGTEVKCDTMSGIIRGLNGGEDPPILHYWSLDCEGCENVALETLDWDKTEVAVLQIELVDERSCGGVVSRCHDLLRSHGMERWMDARVDFDEIWYSKKYFSENGRSPPETPASNTMVSAWRTIVQAVSWFAKEVADSTHDFSENTRQRFDEV